MLNVLDKLTERELVPGYHLACAQSRALIETLADASLDAKAALEDVMDQFFVETATWDWICGSSRLESRQITA